MTGALVLARRRAAGERAARRAALQAWMREHRGVLAPGEVNALSADDQWGWKATFSLRPSNGITLRGPIEKDLAALRKNLLGGRREASVRVSKERPASALSEVELRSALRSARTRLKRAWREVNVLEEEAARREVMPGEQSALGL